MELPPGGPSFPPPHESLMFRTGSDVAGASSARVESRAKARERARERAKEKHHTGLERDPARPGGYVPSPGFLSLPSQVSSALQHPFHGATQARQPPPAYHPPAPSFNFPPEPFSFPSYAAPEPSVSHYFVENPPGAMGGRYPSPSFPSFAPGPPAASSLRPPGGSSFSSLLNEPQYSGFPSQGYYPAQYPSQSRPSRLPPQAGSAYQPPPPSPPSHLVRPGQDRPMPLHSTTPHSLDPNFYNPQIPNRLQGFEELEEEFKP